MAANDRGIGSEGLEQGGPNLGNDYSRPLGTGTTGARDAIIIPHGQENQEKTTDETLNMDTESSRNLSGELTDYDTDLEDDTDDDDMMEDDELQGLETTEEDEEDDENDII